MKCLEVLRQQPAAIRDVAGFSINWPNGPLLTLYSPYVACIWHMISSRCLCQHMAATSV